MSDHKIELNGQPVWVEVADGEIFDIVDINGESIDPTDDQVYDAYQILDDNLQASIEAEEVNQMALDYGFAY